VPSLDGSPNKQPAECVRLMNKALLDFYRCPETLVSLTLAGELSSESGYFCFGDDAVCFGQSSLGSPAKDVGSGLRDLCKHVASDGSTLRLPFDPSQIVDNLRLERYTANGYAGKRAILSSPAIRKAYYYFRPLLGVAVRKHIQRLFLRNWDELSFPTWPVDSTVEHILERLLFLSLKAQKIERAPFIWFWPEGAPSCVIVTHDVETQAGVSSTPSLMDIDDAFGIKASFQVVPQERYPVSKDFLSGIRDRGFELNIQDLSHDGNLFNDREEFLLRSRSINQYLEEYRAQGFRSGCMYRNVDWYDALDISYDMSIPNVAHLEPQRGGCCTVFPYFVGGILELPLTTIQDYSLFHILGDYSTELWKKQIALISKKHGLVSFIVHPDYIMENRALAVYKTLLGYLSDLRNEGKAWIALPRDVNRWWRERSQMKLARQGDTLQIEGPGKERARIAYATLDGDRVVYTIESESQCAYAHGLLHRPEWS
jgi:hypothetical protein